MFGYPGREYWYGGGTKVTDTKLDKVWTKIESKTAHKKNNYTKFPFTDKEFGKYYVLKTDDFSNAEAAEFTASEVTINSEGEEEVLKQRKNKIDWKALKLSVKEKKDKDDKSVKVDNRNKKSFNIANIKKKK